uniref:Transmembrane protein n=2 Tax=Tetraselmis sp. GSL018 TaxID=582737 RepID=A0A061RU08_9CHLO
MVDLPDPGRQGMRALALCGWMFCTTSLVLFLVAISLPSWSVAKEGSSDGKLGLFSFCPDTWHFLNSTVLQELNRTKMQAGCVPVDRFCEVRLGYVVSTSVGRVYAMFSYDVFDPSPGAPLPDLAYETLKVFPGQGSCAAYVGARFWGSVAAVTSAAAWLIAPVGLCSPHRRRRVGFAGSGMACCSVAWGLIAVSVWAGAVLNAATSEHGRAFWCMVAAVATAALSVPFLSAYGRVATACPEFQQPSPGSRYAHFPAYSAQQQYQYGSPGGLRPPPTAALAHAQPWTSPVPGERRAA